MTNPWDDKYPKAFINWYTRHHNYDYKQSCYNAWKAGRKHQKKLAFDDVGPRRRIDYRNIVRWSNGEKS